jgi:hypothetical protein
MEKIEGETRLLAPEHPVGIEPDRAVEIVADVAERRRQVDRRRHEGLLGEFARQPDHMVIADRDLGAEHLGGSRAQNACEAESGRGQHAHDRKKQAAPRSSHAPRSPSMMSPLMR